MKVFDPSVFPNLLDFIPLKSEDIKKIIIEYSLSFEPVKDNRIEWQIKLPAFVPTFYKFIICHNTIPDQKTFYEEYLTDNQNILREYRFEPNIFPGLKASIFKTYPSLVRDFYFGKYLKERLIDTEVIYNIDLDICEGINLMIIKDNTFHALNLFTDTKRARMGRERKEYRHIPFENVNYIELPINLSNCLKCGQFFLFDKTEYECLMKTLDLPDNNQTSLT